MVVATISMVMPTTILMFRMVDMVVMAMGFAMGMVTIMVTMRSIATLISAQFAEIMRSIRGTSKLFSAYTA